MLRLHTFGGVVVREDGVPHSGGASQRKRLALLVLLAAAGQRPVSRDRLLAYLWSEADAERARHSLNQSLHALQRALRTDALFLGTTSLQLNPATISSDVIDFEVALAQGAHERAVELYEGPFLDGFYQDGLPDFEQWAEAERARLARAHVTALECLASSAAARRDHQSAVAWWRRLAAEDPLSSRYAMGLMQALAAVGDRVGALRVAAVHTTLLKQELDAPADPAVAALAEHLRSGGSVTLPAASAHTKDRTTSPDSETRAAPRYGRQKLRESLERAFGARLSIETEIDTRGTIIRYAAYDRSRSIPVELNVINPSVIMLAREEALIEALERLQALDHPQIVPTYEYGWAGDVLFYLLARPEAESLREHLARERQLPIAEAIDIASGIATALAYAHERSVLHGDLRPKHVLLAQGRVMVKSLGVIAAISTAAAPSCSASSIRFGAPAYESPEQLVSAGKLDGRTDVYGLGCILYEMLAGEVPFASSNRHNLIAAKLTQSVPSVRTVRESVPPELDSLLQQCLARLPSDRCRSMAALRDALARIRPTA